MARQFVLDPLCEQCGYNLTGLAGDQCPECGGKFNPAVPFVSHIAWSRRRKIGYFRAYLLTFAQLISHPEAFAAEQLLPSRVAKDADSFQAVTLRVAATSAAAAMTFLTFRLGAGRHLALVVVAFPIFLLYFLAYFAIAAAVSQLTESRSIQSMLSYASAPLALTPLGAAAFCIWLALQKSPYSFNDVNETATVLAIISLAYAACWWLAIFRLILAMRRFNRDLLIQLFILLPFLWGFASIFFGLAGVLLVGVFSLL